MYPLTPLGFALSVFNAEWSSADGFPRVVGLDWHAALMIRRIDVAERRARLAVRHRHVAAARTDDVVAICDGLVALHSTDPVSVYLSAAARMVTPDLAALDAALYADRTLLRHHAMRRTLWVLGHAAARAAHHSATVNLATVQQRQLLKMLAAAGVADPAGWAADAGARIVDLLAARGPLTAREVGATLPHVARQIPVGTGRFTTVISAHSRVLLVLGFEGRVVRARPAGSWINSQYRYAATTTWFPDGFDVDGADPRAAAAELARRWLWTFGPGTRADLQWWAGWTVATTKRALADVGAVAVELDEGVGYLLPDDVDPVGPAPPSAVLLPGLDPSTMGWKRRAFHLDPSTCRPCSTATATAARQSGWTGGWSAAGPSARTAPSPCGCSPTSAPRPAPRSTRAPTPLRRCSARSASTPASRPRSKPPSPAPDRRDQVAPRRRRRAAWTLSRSSVVQNGGRLARRKPP